MALPDPKQKPRTPPKPAPPSKDPKGTAVGRGFETQLGTAKVETGAKGQGFGLSTGGARGDGGVKLGVDGFCCPEYIVDMRDRIIKNWNRNQRAAGVVVMKYMIQRNGQITDVEVGTSSGNPVLDLAAQRALINTRTLAPLPADFPVSGCPWNSSLSTSDKGNHEAQGSELLRCAAGLGAMAILAAQAPPESQQPPTPAAEIGIRTTIRGETGAPPHYAVPDFIALTTDKETVDAAKLIAQVLWDDLSFEREFDMIPRDTYRTIETIPATDTIAYDRWRELGADSVVKGSVRRTGNTFQVEMRLFNVRAREVALGRVYDNVALRNPRAVAHTISDDIHQTQADLRGVARTKLTFISDRDNERVVDTVETRNGKEVYVSDYDGANQMRVTANRRLNITPSWSPDGRSIAYSSYTRVQPQIIVSNVYQGTRETLTDEKTGAYMPVFSPDGSRIAFMSQRDGNPEIYVMNRNGSGVRRLTNNSAAGSTPTWSPTGTQVAFTSDRSGSPQIWVMDGEGLNLRRSLSANRGPTARHGRRRPSTRSRTRPARVRVSTSDLRRGDGPDQDDHRRRRHQRKPGVLTQRPAHRLFLVRLGKTQIFTIARDGRAPADDADGQQHIPELVKLGRRGRLRAHIGHDGHGGNHTYETEIIFCICLVLLIGAAACHKSQPPVARPTPPAPPPPPATRRGRPILRRR